ncbi:MAG: FADH(2)-oxidizing methylenetetrahydrofolate--tRNA-(uracil(54)-C(5))-methyltransferase TrmFO [Clostridiales bacterium]|nr:FADH(2)-oxidizing methylenetetrahydrofolate--tRNA-(uracil(54)-C(5))-methyltransferase TrmFO [Clostridiales bacterium]MCF8022160.1 FADH(2)-oxidizing methylenetetrahydrofolate--tRNA-(uracil(54)-C(5))-methyltransferase TrmFO [Clostridiales bacterium]
MKNKNINITVIGAGLAGVEAAWQAAKAGINVDLYEMRPAKLTPAHHTGDFAELVCSNSLRADAVENAAGLLKKEMRLLDSLIMKCADANQVPAGGALAVDRKNFAREVTEKINNHPQITVYRKELEEIPEGFVVIATGPLTSEAIFENFKKITGENYLYFYDAVAPIVTLESINKDVAFWSTRYGKGQADYLNCPMNEEEYEHFWEELLAAERAPRKSFEKEVNFEGCMPIEVMAARGKDTMKFGPLKPVGLVDARDGKQPYAVVQLRQDNKEGTLYNMVGFQTHLKWGEQERVFRKIPGLENAEFVRFGVMHRNTYINAPALLGPTYQCTYRKELFMAGQVTGVEGYIESASSGIVAGINVARTAVGLDTVVFPQETAHGALANYISSANRRNFQPMNINFGLMPPLGEKVKDKFQRREKIARRALTTMEQWVKDTAALGFVPGDEI